jgi:hypothetical protein
MMSGQIPPKIIYVLEHISVKRFSIKYSVG